MKKWVMVVVGLFILLIIGYIFYVENSGAVYIYFKTSTSGNDANSLYMLQKDGGATGQAYALADGDIAFVSDPSTSGGSTFQVFMFDADSTASSVTGTSHPQAVRPVDYTSGVTGGVWHEMGILYNSGVSTAWVGISGDSIFTTGNSVYYSDTNGVDHELTN